MSQRRGPGGRQWPGSGTEEEACQPRSAWIWRLSVAGSNAAVLPKPLPDCGKFDLKAIDAALDRISGLGSASNALDAWRWKRPGGGSHAG